MTSAWGGGGGTQKVDDSSDKLRECDSDKGGVGAKNFGNFVVNFLCNLQ